MCPSVSPLGEGRGEGSSWTEYESDSELRDTENVPLKDNIHAYFLREVRPHVKDAWLNIDKTQIGYEISFNKYFYQHTPLRSLEEVTAEILALEQATEGLLKKLVSFGGGGLMEGFPRHGSYRDSGIPWLGALPSHWATQKIKFCSEMNGRTLPENTDPNLNISYVDIGSVSQGEIEQTETFSFKNAPSRARGVARKGDTIISTVRTYLKAIAHVGENDAKNIFSTGFCVLSPNKKFHKGYFSYFSQSAPFVNEIVSYSKGVSFPAITPVELGNLVIGVPPLSEQQRIAAFLDQKTAEIDEAINKKQRLIELLREQKAILINQAVTKGMNPNVPMRDSGVEWIGEIPAHWEIRRAKYIFREADERSETGAEELLSVSHMTGVTPRSEKNIYMFMAEDYAGSKLCRKGDLVINIMWAWMGALGVSDRVGIVSPSYGIFRQREYVPQYRVVNSF